MNPDDAIGSARQRGPESSEISSLPVHQTRSKMPAAPCPMPTHMVSMPYFNW
jgi:hypothetical protein